MFPLLCWLCPPMQQRKTHSTLITVSCNFLNFLFLHFDRGTTCLQVTSCSWNFIASASHSLHQFWCSNSTMRQTKGIWEIDQKIKVWVIINHKLISEGVWHMRLRGVMEPPYSRENTSHQMVLYFENEGSIWANRFCSDDSWKFQSITRLEDNNDSSLSLQLCW